jgi:hypothetical protein
VIDGLYVTMLTNLSCNITVLLIYILIVFISRILGGLSPDMLCEFGDIVRTGNMIPQGMMYPHSSFAGIEWQKSNLEVSVSNSGAGSLPPEPDPEKVREARRAAGVPEDIPNKGRPAPKR